MGMRINTNTVTSTALRMLGRSDRSLSKSLERLSTGLRINTAADDPSGLVISEQLRNQISGIRQAMENSQNASNLIGTAEASLNEMHSLLLDMRESVLFALNSGGNDSDQIAAEQDAIDNALRSIDRIAQTTKFGTRKLLDGSSAVTVLSQGANISEIDVQNITFAGQSQQQFTINVTTTASQATVLGTASNYTGTSAADATVRLTGTDGTQDIVIASSFTTTNFDDAINVYTSDTGIFASNGSLYSVDYGSSDSVTLEVLSGTLTNAGTNLTSSSGIVSDTGVDIGGDVDGIAFDGDGTELRVVSDVLTATINMNTTGAGSGTTHTFTVDDAGLTFQLNPHAGTAGREQVGISSLDSSHLGSKARSVRGMAGATVTIGGFLSTLESGAANDLNSDPTNALRILDAAIAEVSDRRAYLGAFQNQTIDTNLNSLAVALEELSQSESTIRDLDFAEETAEYAKNQVLFQSSVAVLAQANQIPQTVLTLLA